MAEYDIAGAFGRIEDELISSMIRNLDRHRAEETDMGFNWTQWQVEQLKALERYKRENRKKFGPEFKDINNKIEAAIREMEKKGGTDAEREILRQIQRGYTPPGDGTKGAFFRTNRRKLDALIKATTDDMKKAETAILRMANDKYRKIIFDAQTYANSGAGTYAKAVDMATKDMAAAGLNCVEYKNGARHRLEDYADMAIRTANKRAYLYGEGERRQAWGVTTVIVNKRTGACPKCLPFCGKVFIDDIWSGGTAKDGDYPLLSSAVEQGLYHPRCKDSHTTYFPGISTSDGSWTKSEIQELAKNEERENVRQYYERQAEKWGRIADTRLDSENREVAKARAHELSKSANALEYSYDDRHNDMSKKSAAQAFTDLPHISHTQDEISQLENYASENGFRLERAKEFHGKSELLMEQIDVLHSLCDEFGYNREIVLGFKPLGNNTFARTSRRGNIFFNANVLTDREFTNNELTHSEPGEHTLASKDIRGIVAHEFGHVLSMKQPDIGLEIAGEAYYNVYGKSLEGDSLVKKIRKILSTYALEDGELIPEVFGRHYTQRNEFTTEFIRLLKERWKL